MSKEMKRPVVFAAPTGKRLYAAFMAHIDPEGAHAIWEMLDGNTKQYYEAAAKRFASGSSLCYKCGKQAPLQTVGDQLLCGECMPSEQEPMRYEYPAAVQADRELYESQTTASSFSSEEAYEQWKEEH